MAATNQKIASNPNSQLKSTQNSMLISEIKDGIVILKDGTMRAVVLASAINFDLMSRQEQDAVEYSYQGFLNSLHFPIQIVVRSQKIDLDRYIETLTELRANQGNELLGLLMEDYIANIKALIDEVNIMNKQFYVVVPYDPPVITKTGFFDKLGGIVKGAGVTVVSEQDFANYKTELSQRVALVASGLNQLGIRAIPLNSQELIDLYYSTYNPDVAANQKLIDSSQLQTPVVLRSDQPTNTSYRQALPEAAADFTVAPASSPIDNQPAMQIPTRSDIPTSNMPMVAPEEPPTAPITQPGPLPEYYAQPAAPVQAPVAGDPNAVIDNPNAYDPFIIQQNQAALAAAQAVAPTTTEPGAQ